MGDAISGLQLKVQDAYNAPVLAKKISRQLHDNYLVNDWTQDFGAFFAAIKMEKSMMFLMLLLIIAVAAFNLVSSLVMVVNDKRADIAILRTLGATPRTILHIFIVQGLLVGLMGTMLGLALGLPLAAHLTPIANWLQDVFHIQFVRSSVYFINFVPSEIQWHDVVTVCLSAIIFSLLATIYPAILAFKAEPAEALRYE